MLSQGFTSYLSCVSSFLNYSEKGKHLKSNERFMSSLSTETFKYKKFHIVNITSIQESNIKIVLAI